MKHIPNIITCLNLFAGCLSCVMALNGNYEGAFYFVVLAAIFDFFDGFCARLLKAFSPIGADLDSLADVVSFGLAPGFVVYSFLTTATIGYSIGTEIAYFAFLIPIFSALRLAKFNIDTRQTTSFLGLPVPANGLFWTALIPSIVPFLENNEILFSGLIVAFIIVFCLLMVSEIPMFSLKFKNFNWEGNEWSFFLIIFSTLFIMVFLFSRTPLLSVSLIIITYIIMSLIKK
jgi:CDP-diacylglycerol--serine O-phosphatidyltransferase